VGIKNDLRLFFGISQEDLAGLLTKFDERDVVFIDEIHRFKSNCRRVSVFSLEDYKIDHNDEISGPMAKIGSDLMLNPFTLIGAY